MANYYQNKVVWVTGASSGIGEALTYAFNEQGAKLVISARRASELNRVKNNCTNKSAEVFILPLDLAKHDELLAKAAEAIAHFGKMDILVNNGGRGFRGLVKDTEMSVHKQIMDVNYFGTIALTKAVLPNMIANKSGQIAVISSLTGKFGTPMRSAYAASKHALHGFFDALQAEVFADGVKITMICPGFVSTNLLTLSLTADGGLNGEEKDSAYKRMPADVFAKKALKAIERQKEEVYIGGKEKMAIYAKRFIPTLFNKVMRTSKVS